MTLVRVPHDGVTLNTCVKNSPYQLDARTTGKSKTSLFDVIPTFSKLEHSRNKVQVLDLLVLLFLCFITPFRGSLQQTVILDNAVNLPEQ